ncbi:MAG: hypothetical protein MMC33_008927 [Icmadophila ericetorum]|nr:hypothetical protein [Icmadophila ericetorum]
MTTRENNWKGQIVNPRRRRIFNSLRQTRENFHNFFSSPSTPLPRLTLFSLPLEIRLQIYAYVLVSHPYVYVPRLPSRLYDARIEPLRPHAGLRTDKMYASTAILRTCSKIYCEALSVFRRQNMFYFLWDNELLLFCWHSRQFEETKYKIESELSPQVQQQLHRTWWSTELTAVSFYLTPSGYVQEFWATLKLCQGLERMELMWTWPKGFGSQHLQRYDIVDGIKAQLEVVCKEIIDKRRRDPGTLVSELTDGCNCEGTKLSSSRA